MWYLTNHHSQRGCGSQRGPIRCTSCGCDHLRAPVLISWIAIEISRPFWKAWTDGGKTAGWGMKRKGLPRWADMICVEGSAEVENLIGDLTKITRSRKADISLGSPSRGGTPPWWSGSRYRRGSPLVNVIHQQRSLKKRSWSRWWNRIQVGYIASLGFPLNWYPSIHKPMV